MNVAPPQLDVYVVVQSFVMSVTGLGMSLVIQGQPNRSAMPPAAPGYVSMQLTQLKRLRTNQDMYDTTDPAPTEVSTEQGTQLKLQLDLYGAAAGDWATMMCTLLRSEFACTALAGSDPSNPVCQPLYANDPFLGALDDSEQQYEQRWTLDAILQYNPVTSVPTQFADTLSITLYSVDEAYPP